jgi:PAS domain S-box-containing protein
MNGEDFAHLQRRWFRRLTVGIAATAAAFAGLLATLGARSGVAVLFMGAATIGALSAVAIVALVLGAHRRLLVASELVATAGIVHAIVQSFLFPFAVPALAVSVVLAVASTLPYVSGRPLRWLVASSVLSSVALSILSGLSPLRDAVPVPVQKLLAVTSLPAATILTALLLLQYSERSRFTREAEVAARLDAERARNALEGLTERLRLALSVAEIGIWDVDLANGALTSDDRCRRLFGLGGNEDLGYSAFLDRIHAEHRDRVHRCIENALSGEDGGRYVVDYPSLALDGGAERWIRSTGQAVFSHGRATRLIGTVEDVTAAKTAESELRGAKENAEEASRAKDEFLAMLGHELRNPLAPILTALELLRVRVGNAGAREREIIHRQVQNLVQLVDDLLDVARIRRGKLTMRHEPVYVRQIVARALEVVSPLLEQHRHRLEVDVQTSDAIVMGDEQRLIQVVTNLLTNAIKYTDPGGTITIQMSATSAEVSLLVRDSGRGIPPSLIPRIFDVFVQGERTPDRSEGGLGLGLTIVRSIIERHGGIVAAFSAGPGRGSEFTVALPAAAVDTPLPAVRPPQAAGPAAGEAMRVLVVDDNEDAARTLCDFLSQGGNVCRTAFDGLSALDVVSEFDPNVVLLDLGLPKLDGYEVAKRIRAMPGGDQRMVVAVTGYGQEQDRQRSAAAGFDAHLVKPVDLNQLLAIVGAATSPDAARRALPELALAGAQRAEHAHQHG